MKKLLTLVLSVIAFHAFSQDWRLKTVVLNKKAKQVVFSNLPAFSFVGNRTLAQRGTYQQLKLNPAFSEQVLAQLPEALQLTIPLGNKQSITCDLVKFSLGNIKFTENSTGIINDPKIPVTYRGIVRGEKNKNTVTLTVNEDYLALSATMEDKVIQVTKADETTSTNYRVYNSAKVNFPVVPFDCGMPEKPAPRTASGIDLTGGSTPTAIRDKCVNVMVDCSDSLYQWRSSSKQSVINYVYELFNSVATGYFNDSVNIQITTINVWTTPSPYRAATRETALAQVAAYWQDNFFGNICVGLDYSINGSGRSGLAGGIGKIKAVSTNTCPAYNYSGTDSISACCYNDLDYNVTVTNFPTGPNTTQQQVYLVMHEMGHLLGAHHTKWCGWKLTSNPDTYGTIDSCGKIERVDNSTPPCQQGPPPPANGATIMSYCVTSNLNGNFVSYNNGFGRLPGNAIRNFIDQSACIMLCVDCFGFINNMDNNNAYAYRTSKGPVVNESTNSRAGTDIPVNNSMDSQDEPFIHSQKTKQ